MFLFRSYVSTTALVECLSITINNAKRMSDLIAICHCFSFAKYDNPSYNMRSRIPWSPASVPNGREHLSITTSPVMKPYFHTDDVYFWNDVIPTLQRALSTSAPVQTTTTPSTPRTPSTSTKPTQHVLSTSTSVKATTTAASTLRFPGYLGSFCQVFVLLMVGRFLTT